MAQFVLTGLTQQFYVEPGDTSVRRGRDVVLHCSVVNLQGTLQWLKNGFGLGTGPHFDGYPRYRIVQQLPANGIASQQSSLYITEANSHCHAIHDKTLLSVSRPLRRCELDSRQLKTVVVRKFEVRTRSVQSSNSHRHTRHDTDRTVLSCLVWRCELSRPDRPTSAFSVGVCRAAQTLPVRPLDALRRTTHLSGGRADSVHTA